MRSRLKSHLRQASSRLGLERDWYLIGLAAVIGLLMGSVAVAYIRPLQMAEHFASEAGAATLWWLITLVPLAGALIAGTLAYLVPIEPAMPGVPMVMYSIHRGKSVLPWKLGVRKWLTSTATIASGNSAGAEGPIVTIGSVAGSLIARWLHLSPQQTATLLGCGAAAGISAVFHAPIAGIFFVLEILLRDFSLRTFTPIVIASVVSAAWTQGLLGSDAIFFVDSDAFTAADHLSLLQIPNYLILGLLCGLAASVFITGLNFSETTFGRLRVHPVFKPAIGAAILALIGVLYVMIQGVPTFPPFYGNGYPEVQRLLGPETYVEHEGAMHPAGQFLMALVALAVFKGIATCLTIGSGGAGGLFAPSLLMGAAVGATLGYIINAVGWTDSASPATYAIVGMAAMVAATTHAPLTAILIVYELTQSYEIILPLMLSAVISTIVGRLVTPHSVYTSKLASVGIQLGAMSDLTILRRLSVHDVPLTKAVTVRGDESASRLLKLSENRHVHDFVVVDDRGQYIGMVTGGDLKSALVYREAIPLLQVHELLRSDLPTVSPSEPLDIVLDKFSRHDVHSLTVLDELKDGHIIGLITRNKLITKYQRALTED